MIGKRPSKGKFLAISGGLAAAHFLAAWGLASIETDYAKILVGGTIVTKGVVIGLNFR
ncbi:hypothetical protein [Novosphingobium sp. Rr 2-17]|uniref:hypothetical protein n=1 Tax=Novosphingobium sp. Rr 2-17 TaxID=555793 RepID=UPI00030BA477|nr:hypothetical protein [Novosphingobium sp. Rr 2-17]